MQNKTSNCKYCGKEISVIQGRRPRQFCETGSCRTNFWREFGDPNKNTTVVQDNKDWLIVAKKKRHEITAKTPEAIAILERYLKELYSPTKKIETAAPKIEEQAVLKSEIDFGDEQYLLLQKHSDRLLPKKPTEKKDLLEWMKAKRNIDDYIRKQWAIHQDYKKQLK